MARNLTGVLLAVGALTAAVVFYWLAPDGDGLAPDGDGPGGTSQGSEQSAGSDAPAESPAEPPHIVLLMLDTLRGDKLGSYGEPHKASPELDWYAEHGVRFTSVLAQSSWTRPSIGSMLTSLYPRTLGIYAERKHILNERFRTLAETLNEAGYRTLGATANPNINSSFNFDQGFDEYVDSNIVFKWMGKDKAQDVAGARVPLTKAPDLFRKVFSLLDAESPTERVRPHYLQINLMEVHEWTKKNLIRSEYQKLFEDLPRAERRYLRTIRQLSADVDDFVHKLQKRRGWEDTVFVFVSDHGEGLLDHPAVRNSTFHGLQLYASQTRVPLFFYDPEDRIPSGIEIERRVRLLELMPTVLQLAHVSRPGGLEGRSLVPLFRDPEAELGIPERFVVETDFRKANKIGVYTDQWKYFENRDDMDVPATALHRVGVTENGSHTNVADTHDRTVQEIKSFLASWEEEHPETSPTERGEELPAAEKEQLRSLGYVQ